MRLLSFLACILYFSGAFVSNAFQSNMKTSISSTLSEKDEDVTFKSLTLGGDYGDCPFLMLGGDSSSSFEMKLQAKSGTFEMGYSEEKTQPILEVTAEKSVFFNAESVVMQDLNINGNLYIDGIQQWRLIAQEGFWSPPDGWSEHQISRCGGAYLLGGYCLTSELPLYKRFEDLPQHSMIRLVSTFHFIDEWTGETAFLKIDINGQGTDFKYLWTDRYAPESGDEGPDVCGLPYGEARFSVPIDVTTAHSASEIVVFFGTSLVSSPCQASYGISNFQIYVR